MYSAIPIALLPKLSAGSIGLNTWFIAAKQAGFDAIEFFEAFPESIKTKRLIEYRETLLRLDLQVSMLTAYSDFAEDGVRAQKKELVHLLGLSRIACLLGTKYIRLFPGYWPQKEPRIKVLDRCAKRLREAVDVLDDNGLSVALENHPAIGTNVEDFTYLLEEIDDNRLRVNFDTSNFHFHAPYQVTAIRAFLPLVVHVHLSDVDEQLNPVRFGTGIVDFASILNELQHCPRSPVYSLESPLECSSADWSLELANLKQMMAKALPAKQYRHICDIVQDSEQRGFPLSNV